jgi:hypothetical protein
MTETERETIMRIFWGSLPVFALACTLMPVAAYTQEVVRPVPGYICTLLSPEDLQIADPSELPPVLAGPSPTAERLGIPTMITIVKWPRHQVGGYIEMLRANGQTGWIEASHLRPWHSMDNTDGKCVPSLLSNGRVGTHIR